jgi:hypothetical protein
MSRIKIYIKIHYFDTFLIKNTFEKCIALYYLEVVMDAVGWVLTHNYIHLNF